MTMSNPHGCCISQVQAPLHVILRPGLWLPGSRTPHLYTETWRIEGSAQNAFKDILNAIEIVENRVRLILRQADEEQLFIQVMSFTKLCNWVDVVEIQFDTALSQTDTVAHVKGFSTGFLPAWIPGSFILNCVLCCIPFGDHGMNAHRIMAIRDSMQLSVNIENGGRAC